MAENSQSSLFDLDGCIHCGLCLSACPTYLVTGLEGENPRGRLMLMNLHEDELKDSTETVFPHIDSCLDCRACETACPSGVDYHHVLDDYRENTIHPEKGSSFLRMLGHELVLRPSILTWCFRFIWTAQKSGILKLLSTFFPFIKGLPRLRWRSFRQSSKCIYPPVGKKRGTVAFFTGCVMNDLYAEVHHAAVRILRWNGYEVHIPKDQTCCGALHHHSDGYDYLNSLQSQNIQAFRDYDIVINNAAGCGAELKEYPDEDFVNKTRDFTEFIAGLDLRQPSVADHQTRILYDAPCHLIHGQGISTPPETLKNFGYIVEDFPQSDLCCGAAGTYVITQPNLSLTILKMKMLQINQASDADTIVTANPGCQLQLQKGCELFSKDKSVIHFCTALDQIYAMDPAYKKAFKNI